MELWEGENHSYRNHLKRPRAAIQVVLRGPNRGVRSVRIRPELAGCALPLPNQNLRQMPRSDSRCCALRFVAVDHG